jgi:putative ABC transport system ATP-binding protein
LPAEGVAARCVDVTKTYRLSTGEVRALEGVSWDFERGRLTAVAGPSGSGKSSLLRLLAGLDRPTAGSVVVGNVHLDSARPRALRRLRRRTVGYVFQRPSDNFFPGLSLGDHLRVAGWERGTRSRIDADRLLARLGLEDRVDHRPSELSGGEQQRGAFAQILLSGADIIVADEPTAELDTGSSKDLLDVMDSLVAEGVTFIVATHDRDVIERASSTMRLDHGRMAGAPTRWQPGTPAPEPGRSLRPAPFPTSVPIPSAAVDPDMERVTVLDVGRVSKSYRRGDETVHAVRDATVRVMEAELVGLVGRSGSGKTTFLNIVSGWERADTGRIHLAGNDLTGATPKWHDLAVVPQKLGLMEELTIRENVEYPARLTDELGARATAVDQLIESFGLDELQHRYPAETSVGEQQRAAVARALVLSPRLVLADEPTGHQDLGWSKGILEALRRAVASGTACVAATHSEELIRYLDRALSMTDGLLSERAG